MLFNESISLPKPPTTHASNPPLEPAMRVTPSVPVGPRAGTSVGSQYVAADGPAWATPLSLPSPFSVSVLQVAPYFSPVQIF
ncbi:uncharacterized protein G2W53_019548 [Senna tora]|uniref:Uncharacterized protein n=1 Tax=Senna tora TaxID=362788 RepID=A0A834TV71_9FABA|nr:uncharacterized protein G2W53_019548 [Senna tora]